MTDEPESKKPKTDEPESVSSSDIKPESVSSSNIKLELAPNDTFERSTTDVYLMDLEDNRVHGVVRKTFTKKSCSLVEFDDGTRRLVVWGTVLSLISPYIAINPNSKKKSILLSRNGIMGRVVLDGQPNNYHLVQFDDGKMIVYTYKELAILVDNANTDVPNLLDVTVPILKKIIEYLPIINQVDLSQVSTGLRDIIYDHDGDDDDITTQKIGSSNGKSGGAVTVMTASLLYSSSSYAASSGNLLHFPSLLHDMLDGAEEKQQTEIVSWCPDGQSFRIHQPKKMLSVLGQYFPRQTKYNSFLHALSMHNFQWIKNRASTISHSNFQRGRWSLCFTMKSKSQDQKKIRNKNLYNKVNTGHWSSTEKAAFVVGFELHGKKWVKIAAVVTTRTDEQCRRYWARHPMEVKGKKLDGQPSEDISETMLDDDVQNITPV